VCFLPCFYCICWYKGAKLQAVLDPRICRSNKLSNGARIEEFVVGRHMKHETCDDQ